MSERSQLQVADGSAQAESAPREQAPGSLGCSLKPLLVVMSALVIVAFGFGPMLLDEYRNKQLLRHGVPAVAEIREIRPTGNYHNDQPQVRIKLDVTSESKDHFEATVTTYMSPVFLPRFQPGATVKIRYDRDDRPESPWLNHESRQTLQVERTDPTV